MGRDRQSIAFAWATIGNGRDDVMKLKYLVCGIVAALAFKTATALEVVRVDASSGAPRLIVDGKPVRARIFWGAPGVGQIALTQEGAPVSFEFSPVEDEPSKATMHFRFGQVPGDVYLDDIRVVDLSARQGTMPTSDFEHGMEGFHRSWTEWPPGAQNTVGMVTVEQGKGRDTSAGLHIALRAPPANNWPDFHIFHHANLALRKGHKYRVSFWGRADPPRSLTVAFYRPGEQYVLLGGPPGVFESQIRMAAEAGANFVSFPIDLPWPKPGQKSDWTAADRVCESVLEANPRAWLLPRIGMDPPAWWRQSHAGDVMAWDKGPQEQVGVVITSRDYLRDASNRLTALVEHLEAHFGKHVAGYHPCGQNTGEWFYQNTWESPLNGYATGDLRAWRTWLRQRYADGSALRTAWRDPRVTLDSAAVPSPTARRAAPAGVLRDPVTERALIDFAEFQQQAMAECVCRLAHAARQASHGRKLVLFFYGYVFEFGAVANGPATAGHYALRRVLNCPDIDVLCSPISYFDRGLGQSAPAMTAAESVALAGKMWLYEDDTRTCLGSGSFPGWVDAVDTVEKTNQELLRNTGQCALRNFGTWWMDLGATGWFNDRRMWAEMQRLAALDEPMLQHPRPFRPAVAAVIDEASMVRVAAGGQVVTVPGVYEVRRALGRMGTPYGQYLIDDVANGRVHAGLYVFLTAWCLSPDQRQQLLATTRGSTCVWCYAPGYLASDRTSLDAMGELTGFRIKRITGVKALAEPTTLGRRLGLHQAIGIAQPLEPLFAVADAGGDEALATYSDGSVAIALRHRGDQRSLFVGPPGLSSELLRLAARNAKVHMYTQSDCNTYANGPYLILHASQDGPLEIDAGRAEPVRDLFTGQSISAGPKFVLPLRRGDTRILTIGEIE
jgi:beta-galactosidase